MGEGKKEGGLVGTQAGRHVSAQMPPSAGKVPRTLACSRGEPGTKRHGAWAGHWP